jgi:anti-anti-sigma factor
MKITRTDMGMVSVLRLQGDIDEDGVQDLRAALLECLKAKRYNLVANVAEVNFISYMGLGVLVERLRQFRAYEGDLKLVALNTYCERMFRMLGVTRVFDTHATEGQAVEAFKSAA